MLRCLHPTGMMLCTSQLGMILLSLLREQSVKQLPCPEVPNPAVRRSCHQPWTSLAGARGMPSTAASLLEVARCLPNMQLPVHENGRSAQNVLLWHGALLVTWFLLGLTCIQQCFMRSSHGCFYRMHGLQEPVPAAPSAKACQEGGHAAWDLSPMQVCKPIARSSQPNVQCVALPHCTPYHHATSRSQLLQGVMRFWNTLARTSLKVSVVCAMTMTQGSIRALQPSAEQGCRPSSSSSTMAGR